MWKFAVIGALAIGLTLGLLGSGGSILTVPILVYLIGEPEKLAIGESLGIVAFISLAGFIPYALKKQVHWRSIIFFGLPGMGGTYLGAWVSQFVSGRFQLLLFAVVMLVAAVLMLRDSKEIDPDPRPGGHAFWKIILEGLGVGILTGLVGVGGGFLIVPALVLMGGLSMYLAVGTSLGIIAMKSFSGLYGYIDVLSTLDMAMNWKLIAVFSVIGAAGSLAGKTLGSYLPQAQLKKVFALFLVVMGAYMIYMNVGGL